MSSSERDKLLYDDNDDVALTVTKIPIHVKLIWDTLYVNG